jgi:hypothetical protein
MAPIEFKRPKPAIFLLRPTDLSPAMLAVQVYGCASRTDLGALATESHRLRGSSSLTR